MKRYTQTSKIQLVLKFERLRTLVAGLVPATEPWGRAMVTITRYVSNSAARSDQGDEEFPGHISRSDTQPMPSPAYSLSSFLPIEQNFSIRSAMTGKTRRVIRVHGIRPFRSADVVAGVAETGTAVGFF